jgi:uncharacterized protein (DUF1919 family)
MSIDKGYEAYRQAMAEAEAEIGEANENWRNSNPRTARFELHMKGTVPDEISETILRHFGYYQVREPVVLTADGEVEDWSVCVWDVEEPSMHGAIVKNLNVRTAELTKHDAYLVWYAVTGFPMLYERGTA